MFNEEDYQEFVNSVAGFVSTTMTIWTAQRNLNVVVQNRLEESHEIITIYSKLLKELRDQNVAYKTLLIEHEKRLIEIERSLQEETVYKGFDMPKGN